MDDPDHLPSFQEDGKYLAKISALIRAFNKLALDMYTKINSENPNGNIVFSPLSIALALALTETAASGESRNEIHKLIGPSLYEETDECGQLYGALQEEILKIYDEYGEIGIANSFFHDVSISVKDDFLKNVEEWLKTEIKQVPFEKDVVKARQLINQWVSDKTNGKIPQLFGPGELTPNAALILVNAAYLKMDWEIPFSLENTTEKIFYRFGGIEEQQVPFMCRCEKGIQYAGRKTLRVVELPYKITRLSMYIVLPRRRDRLTDIEHCLTIDRLINLFKSTAASQVNLQMPRFAMRCRTPLLPKFRQMGFQTFNELKQMTDVPVEISDAVHEAYIKVTEEGTEASAVIQGGWGCQPSISKTESRYNFIADHPFLFFIVHKPTWSVVFMGKVNSVDCE